jgi:hypothetical protein
VSTPLPPSDWRSPVPVQIPIAPASPNGNLRRLSEFEPEEVRYVEYPLLQAATFHVLAGRPDIGKGVLCARWVARCTNGLMYGEPRDALWLSSEDSTKRALRPRLDVAEGDPGRVALMPLSFQLPRDIDWLREKITSASDRIGLIVIDPLANHLGGIDSNTEEPIRNALMPLNDLADEIDAPIIGIRHVSTKEARGAGFIARVLGSSAWIAIPRVVLGVASDEEERLHVRPIKGNAAPKSDSGRRFRLAGVEYRDYERGMVRAIEDGESDVDLDALLGTKRERGAMRQARVEIVRVLREQGGTMPSDQLDSLIALRIGMAASTVKKTRKELREWGWLSAHPSRDGEKITAWNVSLTNAAPYERDLEAAVEDPLAYAAEARSTDLPRARGERDNISLAENYENLSLDLSLPDSTGTRSPTAVVEDSGTPSPSATALPLAPVTASGTACPACGSTNIGFISGTCYGCGTKVRDLNLD